MLYIQPRHVEILIMVRGNVFIEMCPWLVIQWGESERDYIARNNCKNSETKKVDVGRRLSTGTATRVLGSRIDSSGACPTRQEVRVLLYALRHLDGNGIHEVLKHSLDVVAVFGARFEELEAEGLGEFSTLLLWDGSTVCQVALVAHQNCPGVLPRQVLDCGCPAGKWDREDRREKGRGRKERERGGSGTQCEDLTKGTFCSEAFRLRELLHVSLCVCVCVCEWLNRWNWPQQFYQWFHTYRKWAGVYIHTGLQYRMWTNFHST